MSPVVQTILPMPPFDKARSADLIASVQNVPSVITDAEANLQKPCAPFAKLAIESLTDIRTRLWEMAHEAYAAAERRQFAGAIARGGACRRLS